MINLKSQIDDLEWDEIYPGIICYRNMLKNPKEAYETMQKAAAAENERLRELLMDATREIEAASAGE